MGIDYVVCRKTIRDSTRLVCEGLISVDNHIDVDAEYRLLPDAGLEVQAPMNDAMKVMLEELYDK